MNNHIIKQTRAGFRFDETLATRLQFSGIIRFWERSHIKKDTPQGPVEYWALKDEYGARLSCFDDYLAEIIVLGERYMVSGEIKIGKGGTFFNLKRATIMNGHAFDVREEDKED